MREGLSGEVSGGGEFQVNFSGCIHENRVEKKRCIKYTKNGVECSRIGSIINGGRRILRGSSQALD